MRATELLEPQFNSVNQILHGIADDLTPKGLVTRALPNTNLIGFDLWHVARTQDWALQTLVRGVPEIIDESRWERLHVSPGIGVGLSEAQADELAHRVVLADVLAYADAAHRAILEWLRKIPDRELGRMPEVRKHLARYPVYLEQAMCDEVPWLFQRPQVWRCLAPALGHVRDHLAEMDLLKRQLRRMPG
jgi:DinB superfamily